jgi:hypothetical protein
MLPTVASTYELRERDPNGYEVPSIVAGLFIASSLVQGFLIVLAYVIDQTAPCPWPAYILFGFMLATTWLCIEGISYLIRDRMILPNPRAPEPQFVETSAGLIAANRATIDSGSPVYYNSANQRMTVVGGSTSGGGTSMSSTSPRATPRLNNKPITASSMERPRTILRTDDK